MNINYYLGILHLPADASLEDIKKAYRQLAKQYHPDINKKPNAHEKFIEISEAYDMLVNYKQQQQDLPDAETIVRKEYEKARRAARERAEQNARMKYEKFKNENEVFKESGWYDLFLLFRYMYRWILIPFTVFLILLPLYSEDIGSHPTGYVITWLMAVFIILFIYNHRKKYFLPGEFYYSLNNFWKKIIEYKKMPQGTFCYYCQGKPANARPFKIEMFKTLKAQINSYAGVRGSSVGFKKSYKTLYIPRSKKAFIVHSICTAIKAISILLSIIFIPYNINFQWKIVFGIFIGFFISYLVLLITKTKSKVSHWYSPGMFIKFGLYLIFLVLMPYYAYLYLMFESFLEATLRYISNDSLYTPIVKQNHQLELLLQHRYQFYNELPVWSVVYPFIRWII